jgi:hypothetical protein
MEVIMSKQTILHKFTEVMVAADRGIRQTHGIMCYQDGNFENKDISNVYISHISDVMNIHMREKMGLCTILLIPTHSLGFIHGTSRNQFIEEMLSSDMLTFIEENIDFFYRLYCYYANNSFVPVRTCVDCKYTTFKLSQFFMNDSFFTNTKKASLVNLTK